MNRRIVPIACLGITLLFTAAVAHAEDSCPAPCTKIPKSVRHVSTTVPSPFPVTLSPFLSTPGATLAKGIKKNVVTVEVTLVNTFPSAPLLMVVQPVVNGLPMQPPFPIAADCGGTSLSTLPRTAACTLSGSFWLDIDQAETTSPGTFVGQPLTVTLLAADASGVGSETGFASMSVRQEKKK
jgi:hypothetical protein